jgi:hypothetical protein
MFLYLQKCWQFGCRNSVAIYLLLLGYFFIIWHTPDAGREHRSHVGHGNCCTTIRAPGALEGPAQDVPGVTTETVEWCVPAVRRLAWCETFSNRVDPSEPARFFIVSSVSMLWANSVSKFLMWASFLSKFLLWANLTFVSSFSLLWANFLRFEQFECR